MSNEYMAGYALGVFIVLFVTMVLFVFMKRFTSKDGKIKCNFDERQELVRGRGFKYGFFTLLVYDMLLCVLGSASPKVLESVSMELLMFFGVALSIIMFASYCIWNEGYFALNEHPKKILILFAFIAIINMIIGISNIMENKIIVDGVLTFHCSNIVCAAMFFVIFTVLLVKTLLNRKEEA